MGEESLVGPPTFSPTHCMARAAVGLALGEDRLHLCGQDPPLPRLHPDVGAVCPSTLWAQVASM